MDDRILYGIQLSKDFFLGYVIVSVVTIAYVVVSLKRTEGQGTRISNLLMFLLIIATLSITLEQRYIQHILRSNHHIVNNSIPDYASIILLCTWGIVIYYYLYKSFLLHYKAKDEKASIRSTTDGLIGICLCSCIILYNVQSERVNGAGLKVALISRDDLAFAVTFIMMIIFGLIALSLLLFRIKHKKMQTGDKPVRPDQAYGRRACLLMKAYLFALYIFIAIQFLQVR